MRLIAVGDRQPSWVDTAVDEYLRRLPRHWQFQLDQVVTRQRSAGRGPRIAAGEESKKILARLQPGEFLVLVDERGRALSSPELAKSLDAWQQAGRDVAFVIGGPEGVSDECRQRADFSWSLSRLTLPHGLARIMVAEQLYRAWSLTTGHPYHRS